MNKYTGEKRQQVNIEYRRAAQILTQQGAVGDDLEYFSWIHV